MDDASSYQTIRGSLTKNGRRRSLKTLFQLPLSSRTSIYGSISGTLPVGSIPADIVREIVDLLAPSDILNFSLASKHLRAMLLPALYETVTLKSSKNCRVTLSMLKSRKDICGYVRKLAVRPNYYLAWPRPDEQLSEEWVVSMIEDISMDLISLHTFDWDGLELPDDSLWHTLRSNCPELKSVFSNVGTRPLDPSSTLFDFSNLTSFSLIVRHGLGGSDLFPELEALPPRLWDMLRTRCPDLQELAICSFSSSARVFDFDPITDGHWPKLHTLTLGSFGYQQDFSLGPPALNNNSLSSFLDSHTNLKYIRFLWNFKRWMSPDNIPMHLSEKSLPALDTFIGVYQQLAELPNPQVVETLDLTCEPVYESRLEAVCPVLRTLTNLTSLDIWTHVFDTSRDHSLFFFSILTSCPKLTDFHFMCTTSFTVKPLKQLITQLYLLPSLKRFSLTKGHKYVDESMLSTALRILKYNPALKQINIRWAREKCPNHLKQEGCYDVVVDKHGRPEALAVVERGIPLWGVPFLRRYRHRLDKGGHSEFRRWVRGKNVRVIPL
ncbi:hypothetical protein JR316_0011902 [Psilocybe cubensis]|uniref:F-box domain-containing protein n=2 Tax=Psilocybe cubensis TaxID=181762 RepID=A0A8H7XNB2_PSICU|nr:hypothetical protein JR316_0011902 [Psilocybe cubensis]KAH9476327.1 hypothetical protein JR316_0011902 [Psilocybe cubensis]